VLQERLPRDAFCRVSVTTGTGSVGDARPDRGTIHRVFSGRLRVALVAFGRRTTSIIRAVFSVLRSVIFARLLSPYLCRVFIISEHGEGLASTSLAIHKNGAVHPVERRENDLLATAEIDLLVLDALVITVIWQRVIQKFLTYRIGRHCRVAQP